MGHLSQLKVSIYNKYNVLLYSSFELLFILQPVK